MYLVAIAWLYVAVMMAIAEATHSQGTVLGAIITFVLYGVLPLSLVMYLLGTPMRRRRRLQQELRAQSETTDVVQPEATLADVPTAEQRVASDKSRGG
jgi:mannose/fructose/N-acetylgalactosamine-specific phosphotransferase system component IID